MTKIIYSLDLKKLITSINFLEVIWGLYTFLSLALLELVDLTWHSVIGILLVWFFLMFQYLGNIFLAASANRDNSS